MTAAYNQLIAEGYLVTRPGARASVAEGLGPAATPTLAPAAGPRHLSAFARRLLAKPPLPPTQPVRVADFRYGNLSGADFPLSPWRRALNKASLRRTARLRYDDPQGAASLRAALQGYLWRARGISCAPEQIVVVNGSQQGLDLCARLLLDPGDRLARTCRSGVPRARLHPYRRRIVPLSVNRRRKLTPDWSGPLRADRIGDMN